MLYRLAWGLCLINISIILENYTCTHNTKQLTKVGWMRLKATEVATSNCRQSPVESSDHSCVCAVAKILWLHPPWKLLLYFRDTLFSCYSLQQAKQQGSRWSKPYIRSCAHYLASLYLYSFPTFYFLCLYLGQLCSFSYIPCLSVICTCNRWSASSVIKELERIRKKK